MSTSDCMLASNAMFANNSGTQEELDLLCAHLGIFDSHVEAFEDYCTDLALAEWEAEYESYAESCGTEFPNSEFPFDPINTKGWEF